MIKLLLSSSLARMLPTDLRAEGSARVTLDLDADDWPGAVKQIGSRYEALARHAFDADGQLRAGLLLSVNDELVTSRRRAPQVKDGDEVFLFTQIAGG